MRLPMFDLEIVRHAGQRRVREANDIARYFERLAVTGGHPSPEHVLNALTGRSPIGGGAQKVIAITQAATALAAAQATYIGPLYDLPLAPLTLCLHYLPQIAGTTAAATITLQMRRTDTPAVISNAVKLCGTADTNPGPFMMMGVLLGQSVPAGSGVDVQGAASAGAGTPTGSATAPILLAALGVS